ncbi:MAG: phosphatidylserine decarboxylase family protein [Flavobacteriales bacterium]|nr:phosphatidylserine decarboxylase family protein [Flavobacteriales bacterium]
MKIHNEGFKIITLFFLLLAGIDFVLIYFIPITWIWSILVGASVIFFYLIVSFFRVPKRAVTIDGNKILAPSDGKVVVIEEVQETEYLNDKYTQISIFMSPLNVHCQWYPINGIVKYFKYHPGKYLVAWHPKSSTENERTTIVVEDLEGRKILFRQIAGAVARRIVYFGKEGEEARQDKEAGFIKFGSRIDVFIPLKSTINVKIGENVVGSQTVLATFD